MRILAIFVLLALLVAGCSETDRDLTAGTAFFDQLDANGVNIVNDDLTVDGVRISPASYGEMYLTVPAATAIVAPGTYYHLAGTEDYDELRDFTGDNTSLTYSGDRTRMFMVHGAATLKSDTVNTVVTWVMAVNNTPHASGYISTKIAVANDRQSVSFVNILSLDPGDHVELFLTADKAAAITADYAVLTVASLD